MNSRHILFVVILIATVLGFTAGAMRAYPGSGIVLVWYSLAFALLIGAVFWSRVSIGFLFFGAFLFLGFWTKLMAHLIFGYELIEPTGAFEGTAEEWDQALDVAAMGAAGAATGKALLGPLLERFIPGGRVVECTGRSVPMWYPVWRRQLWIIYLTILVVVCAANYQYSFYQIGVEPRLIFPAHLNVLLAWLINVGFALGLAVLINWEIGLPPRRVVLLGSVAGAQAVIVSISALSRSIIVFQVAPAFAVLGVYLWAQGYRKKLLALGSVAFLITVLVAFAVTTIRFLTYPLPPSYDIPNSVTGVMERVGPFEAIESPYTDEPSRAAIRAGIRAEIVRHVGTLFLGRWVGLEGVLATSSSPETGVPLLIQAAREDPRMGNNSIYQKIAGAEGYTRQSKAGEFTFLTLPGVVGVLAYSGSKTIVFLGMLLVAVALMLIERIAVVSTKNALFGITASIALANVFVQMNFPYLSLVFIAQLLFATGVIAVIQRWRPAPIRAR